MMRFRMNCCINCFKDPVIIDIIKSENTIGNCDICNTINTQVVDISNNLLRENFQKLVEVYTPVSNLTDGIFNFKSDYLSNFLTKQWNLFDLSEEEVNKLLIGLLPEKYKEEPELFSSEVYIQGLLSSNYIHTYSILGQNTWEDFVEEIKTYNRFHTRIVKENIFEKVLKYSIKKYKSGTEFYRGRIWNDNNGFDKNNLGAPPSKKATAGRANPVGISCLYIANSVETTLNETRAGVHDWISVGKFVLKQDLEIIDLAMLDKISPFLDVDIDLIAANIEHLRKIGNEIARPLRRHDSNLDYLPTQFISDYIKSLGYHGIQYKSTMCADGVNLAIFDQHLLVCTEVKDYDITGLKYNYKKKN